MMSIKPISPADYADWLELWQGYLSFYEATLDGAITSETFTRLVDGGSDIHGAIARDEGGTAVGIVHWLTHPATWSRSTYCYLEDLFVSSTARGGGHGKALVEHVRGWAHERGSTKVYWLTAETNTTARALYDRVATRSGMIQYQIELS